MKKKKKRLSSLLVVEIHGTSWQFDKLIRKGI